jgi:hypothetical protein
MNTGVRILLVALLFPSIGVYAQLKADSTEKPVRFAAIPMINYNRTQGIIVGAVVSAFYNVNKKDTLSPPSNTALMGIYTAEQSWIAGVGQLLYLKQDKWRIKSFAVVGNVNYQYFNGDANTNVGQYEDYSNKVVRVKSSVTSGGDYTAVCMQNTITPRLISQKKAIRSTNARSTILPMCIQSG